MVPGFLRVVERAIFRGIGVEGGFVGGEDESLVFDRCNRIRRDSPT